MWMRIQLAVVVCSLYFVTSLVANEEQGEPEKPSTEERLAKIAKLGPGVHAIKKDKKGQIVSCLVVGQARISTALGKAKGLEIARDKANLAASAEFVKWLKEDVAVYQSSEDESVILIEGAEDADDDTLKESGKAVEKNSTKMESVSKGLVRGLQPLYKAVDGDGKTYTIIKGWSLKNSDATKEVASDSLNDNPKSRKNGKRAAAKKPKNIDKDIESDSVVSDDADSFLP